MEFIMVDNGSEEDTASTLLAALRNAPVLRMGRNAHWAGGNNAGMRCRSAASTATLFWNNDAVPLEGTMVEYTHMARTMQRSAIGAVGCALQYPDGRLQVRWWGVGSVVARVRTRSAGGLRTISGPACLVYAPAAVGSRLHHLG